MRYWRPVAAVAALVVLAWVGYEIGIAGSEVAPPPPLSATATLREGQISGKRVDNRWWSLDYDTITMSPDASTGTIAHVRDGRIHRPGQPDVHVRATGVTIDRATGDVTVTGPIRIVEPLPGGRTRTITTTGARYEGTAQTLVLKNPVTITEGGATVTVAHATLNFHTGAAKLGRIAGVAPGTTP